MERGQVSWDRLQRLLEHLTPGDEVRVSSAAHSTGLDPKTCTMVFEALARAELFRQTAGEVFVRQRLHP